MKKLIRFFFFQSPLLAQLSLLDSTGIVFRLSTINLLSLLDLGLYVLVNVPKVEELIYLRVDSLNTVTNSFYAIA